MPDPMKCAMLRGQLSAAQTAKAQAETQRNAVILAIINMDPGHPATYTSADCGARIAAILAMNPKPMSWQMLVFNYTAIIAANDSIAQYEATIEQIEDEIEAEGCE